MANLKNLTVDCGNQMPPGTIIDLYYTCSCELNAFPGTLTTTNPGDSVTLDGPFDFTGAATGEGYWRKTQMLINTGGIKQVVEGEVGGQGLMASGRFFIVGTEAEQAEFAENMVKASGCLVLMMKQRESDMMRVIGSKDIPAVVESIEFDGGEKIGDRNGAAYSIKAETGIRYYDDATHGINVTPAP